MLKMNPHMPQFGQGLFIFAQRGFIFSNHQHFSISTSIMWSCRTFPAFGGSISPGQNSLLCHLTSESLDSDW